MEVQRIKRLSNKVKKPPKTTVTRNFHFLEMQFYLDKDETENVGESSNIWKQSEKNALFWANIIK